MWGLFHLLILAGSHVSEALEVFGEERGIGEMQFLTYLHYALVAVTKHYLCLCDKGTVYPVLGGGAAGLADDGGQVALGEAHTVSIVAYLVLFGTMLGDQLKETVEDSLLARL